MRAVILVVLLSAMASSPVDTQPAKRARRGSPVMIPRKFVLEQLCESPTWDSDAVFGHLCQHGFPASDRGVFDALYSEYQRKTRMSSHMHTLLMEIALAGTSPEDEEFNQFVLSRQLDSLSRRGLDRQSLERQIENWMQVCIGPLIAGVGSRVPCSLVAETDEWILSDSQARQLFCLEFRATALT